MRNFTTTGLLLALFSFSTLVTYLNRSIALVLTLAALAALAQSIRTKSAFPRPDPAMLLFLLWGALSAFWEFDHGLALPQVAQLIGLVVAGSWLCASTAMVSAKDNQTIVRALIAGIILALGLYFLDWSQDCIILNAQQSWRHDTQPTGCWIASEKNLATILTVLIPLLVGWAWGNWRKLILVAGLSAAVIASSRISDSHASVLALCVAGATWVGCRVLGARLMGKIVAACTVVYVLCAPLLPPLMPQPKEMAEHDPWVPNSTRHRVMIWQFTADRIKEHPILGWGLNGSRSIPGNKDRVEIWLSSGDKSLITVFADQLPLHPHNFALQIWLETGAIGAILLSLVLWRLFTKMSRQWGAPALAAGTAALVVASVSYGIWQAWWLSCLWLFAAVTPALLTRPQQNEVVARSLS